MARSRDFSVTTWRCATGLVTVLAPFVAVVAQDATDVVAIIEPEPIERANPDYPERELRTGREGWVALSFIVTEAGDVMEAMIEDSSGNEGLESAAIAAVSKWRFKPATIDGTPVDRSTNTVIRFSIEQGVTGAMRASRAFIASFNEIQSLLVAKDVQTAERLLADLRSKEERNLYEDAWLWWLEYLYLNVTNGNAEAQRAALAKAVGYDVRYLDPDLFATASARLFVLRVNAGDLGGAMKTYERLTSDEEAQTTAVYAELQPQLEAIVGEIDRVVAGESMMLLRGRITEHDSWVHPLLRRTFSLSDVAGSLERLSIRCSRRTVSFSPATYERTWTVPVSYGDCSVALIGTPGTTFDFFEHPPGTAETTVPLGEER
jgi:TonB family protein